MSASFAIVFKQVFMLLIYAMIGFVLCRSGAVKCEDSKILSALEVYLFVPCSVFKTCAANFTVEYIRREYVEIIFAVCLLAAAVVSSYFISKLLTKDGYEQKIYWYALACPNLGYIGYALAQGIYGDAVFLNFIIFALPTSMYINTVGLATLTKNKISLKTLVQPATISIIVGCFIGVTGLRLPDIPFFNAALDVLGSVLDGCGACMAPVSMILAGIVISQFNFKEVFLAPKAYLTVFIRMIAMPVAVMFAIRPFSPSVSVVTSAILLYAMPCGLNTIVFPKLVNENSRVGAQLSTISTVLGCLTIPLLMSLFAPPAA